MKSILIIQERGRNEANREFRESENFRRAFNRLGVSCEVWGLNQPTFSESFDSIVSRHDVVFVLENYDQAGWLPDLSKVSKLKVFWSIDSHCALGQHVFFSKKSRFDIHLNSSRAYLSYFKRYSDKCIWFPNAYPADLFESEPSTPVEKAGLGFCGSMIGSRAAWLNEIEARTGISVKRDVGVLGKAMIDAVRGYSVGLNCSIADDLNYRVFETLGARTCLLTNEVPGIVEMFVEDKHLVVYRSMEELVDKAKWLLSRPEEAARIAQEGHEHVRANHTYDHRAAEFLRIVEGEAQ